MTQRKEIVSEVDESILAGWQTIVNLMAKICDVPAGLIMRVTSKDLEVFVSSQTDGNPYHVGDKEQFIGSGLYCERVIRTASPLHVPNARADDNWCNNPDIKLNMIAYHGYPIIAPSGDVFGTICILDKKPRTLDSVYNQLITMFKTYIEHDLHAIVLNKELRKQNIELKQQIAMIRTLENILPMCARCKKIRLPNEKASNPKSWVDLATYIQTHTDTEFSHGMCPVCHQEFYGNEAPPYEDG
jgi:GAF domain-containing protein